MKATFSTKCSTVLRLAWLATTGHGLTAGRVILHRTVVSDDYPDQPVAEVWLSPVVDQFEALASRQAFTRAHWSRLVYGLRVPEVDGPVPLRKPDRTELASLEEQLSRPGGLPRPLLELHARAAASDRHRTVESASLAWANADLLARTFSSPARETLRRLRLASAGRGQSPTQMPGRETRATAAALSRIELKDVRGVQIGNDTLQINRVIARASRTEMNFDEVLRRGRVTNAVQRLQRNPADGALRASLVDALSSPGWSFRIKPTRIEVGAPKESGLSGLLRSLLVADVRGLQIGDHSRQTNNFVYAIPSLPTGSDLLRDNPRLSQALADQLCPRSNAEQDVARLAGRLKETLDLLPLAWRDGRIHGLRAYPPDEGEVLRIRRADGVTIGTGGRQVTSEATDFSAVTISTRFRPKPLVRTERGHSDSAAARITTGAERAERAAAEARDELDDAQILSRRARIAAERAWAKAIVARDDLARDDNERTRVRANRAETEAGRTRTDAELTGRRLERAQAHVVKVEVEVREAREAVQRLQREALAREERTRAARHIQARSMRI